MDSSKSIIGCGAKTTESQGRSDDVDAVVNEDASESLANITGMMDSDAMPVPFQEGTLRRGPGRPRKENISAVTTGTKKISQRQRIKKTPGSSSVGESLSELIGSESPEMPVPADVVSYSKDVDMETVKSEVLLGDITGTSSPRVSSSFTPKHDSNFDISFTDTGDSSSRTSLTISAEKMASEDSIASEEMSSCGTLDKVCAFCNRGEKSLLGQGELTRYEPTSSFNPFKKQLSRSKRTSSDPDEAIGRRSSQHLTWRRSRGASRPISGDKSKAACHSQLQSADEHSLPATVDELSLVGYSEDTDVAQVFEKTGHIWAHHCCAAWSEGVTQSEDFSLHSVDKAVFSGLSQKCSYCCHYGATIKCRDSRCNKKYHYPCASGGGCFQDIKTLSLLCPDHTDQAVAIANQEAFCVVCETPGSISDQLFCTSCGQHYHGNCLDPAVEVNPVVRAGWQCPECKICQTCRQPGDDNKMLVCDTCDKGYHTFCLQPAMTTIPKNGWKCKNCRICGDCGSRTPGSGNSSRWHLNYSVCDSCYQQRNKGLCCPVCCKAYRQFSQNKMVPCCLCKRYVHAECDESLDVNKVDQEDYVCLACKNRDTAGFEIGSQTDSLSSIVDETSLQDIENFSIFKGLKEGELDPNHEPGFEGDDFMQNPQALMMADDSMPCSEIDLNAINKVVQRLDTPSTVVQSNSMSEINNGSDVSLASDSKTAIIGSDLAIPRPVGPGMGKPMFTEQYEKKLSAGRNKNRSIGIGKKKRMTSHPPANGKRGPKPKLKQMSSSQSGNSTDQGSKDDDHSSTIVLCSAKDQFTLKQDMCLSCGSYGKGEEGKLIACVQCGQCYHPYCVNLKVSVAMLQKGWRCLDCTVCEGCGKPHDESRLILCDECDISYHIYCLDPPLDSVPQGSWKCKWCIVCTTCGANTPGVGCQWSDNYSQCGPCASLEVCPFCNVGYIEGDLIIQCSHCSRWIHAACDGLKNEDDVEAALDYGYHCMLCRPTTGVSGPFRPPSLDKQESVRSGLSTPLPPLLPTVTQPQAPSKDPELPKVPKTFFLDGVCLSEAGINLIRNKSLKITEKKRPRWRRCATHPALVPMLSMSSEKSEDDVDNDSKSMAVDPMDGDECKVEMPHDDWDMTSPTYDKPLDPGMGLGLAMDKKKKPRPRMGMGIGGFLPRQRTRGGGMVRSRLGSGLSKPFSLGDVSSSGLDPFGKEDDECRVDADGKKPKRKPRKVVRKSLLEDSYPACLQEAFFGRFLLDKCKTSGPEDFEQMSDDDKDDFARISNLVTSKTVVKSDDPFEFSDSPPSVDRVPGGGYRSEGQSSSSAPWLIQQHQQLSQPHQLHLTAVSSSESAVSTSLPSNQIELQQQHQDDDSDKDHDIGDALDVLPEEPLDVDDILIDDCFRDIPAQSDHSPMLSSSIDELAQIDNETLEDILKNGLSGDQHSEHSPTAHGDGSFTLGSLPGTSLQTASHGSMLSKDSLQVQRDEVFGGQNTSSSSISPFSPTLGADDFPGLEFAEPWAGGSQFDPHHQNLSSHMMPGNSVGDCDANENLSYNQKNVKKWKKDEPLGDLATISPVLFANIIHPDLKTKYPEWNDRSKHISKLWRKVPPEERARFLAKAKENRAASRLQKQQKFTQEAKRKQKESASSSGGVTIGLGSYSGMPLTSTPQASDVLSHEQPDTPSNVNMMQPHLPSHTTALVKDKAQTESDPYSFGAHSSSSRSSPGGNYGIQHLPGPIFKQPHPPTQNFDQLTPGTPRQTAEMFMSHHPLHQVQVGGAADPYARPPLTPGASPNELSPSHFIRHPNTVRPMPGSSHAPNLGNFKLSPTAEGYGARMFAPSFPPPSSSRFPEQFGYGDPRLRAADRFQSPLGSASTHSTEQFVGSTSGLTQSHEADHSASKGQKHPEGHKQVPPMLQRSVSEPFGRPMLPRADPYSHAPMTPRPAAADIYGHSPMTPRPTSEPYGHGPVTPRSNITDPYAQPPPTPKPNVADHYAQPAITPKPAVNDPYAMASRTNSDPYSQPPMTSRPGSDSFGQTPLTSRPSTDPYSQPVATPRPNTDPYGQPSIVPRPSQDPYSQPPMTPRPSQDPYSQPPMTPRPSQDPYSQPPMTPRPSQDLYSQPPMTPRPSQDPYSQPPMTPRPSQDPYSQPPMTPRPSQDPYSQPPMTPRPSQDPYSQPPMTPRPSQDLYSQPPMTPRPSQDPYSQPPMTPRPSQDPYSQPPMTPRPSQDPYSQSPVTPRPSTDPYGQPVITPRPQSDLYCQPALMQRQNPDPYSQPPMTPRPSPEQFGHPLTPRAQTDSYGQVTSRPNANATDQFGQQIMSVRPAVTEAYVHRSLTPRASTTDAFGTSVCHRANMPDPYLHPPMTPRPSGPDGYGQIGMRPSFSESYMQQRSSRPVVPGVAASGDPYVQAPLTPQLMARTHQSEEYTGTAGGSGVSPVVSSQVTAGSELFPTPTASRAVTSESYRMSSSGVEPYSSSLQQAQGVARTPSESPVADVQSTVKGLIKDEAEVANSSMLEGEQPKQDSQKTHLKELLAKQSKQRQKQKKQEENKRILQEQSAIGSTPGSLRHWPDDPSGVSYQAGTVGFSPYDSVQRVGVDMINNPNVGIRGQLEMDRWPKEQLIRMPHPGHIRPRLEVEQFGLRGATEDMIHQRFPLPVRGSAMRPALAANIPYAAMPYQQQQSPSQQQQQDLFSLQHHQTGFRGPSERFRRSTSVSGETGIGQKSQPPMPHRPATPLPGQEGISFGFHPSRMTHAGSVIPGLARMPDSYEPMIRGQAGPRIGSLPQHMMHQWPQQRNLQMESSYGMVHPGGMIGSMRPMYPDQTGNPVGSSHLQHHSQMGQTMPGQNFGAAIHPSMMPPVQQPGLPIGQPHQEMDKSADQFEDILETANDEFSLLEYADPDLDNTLTEQHDKSIFDEHLGITSKSSSAASTEASQSVSARTQPPQSGFELESKTGLKESVVTDSSGPLLNQSAVVNTTEVPPVPPIKPAKPESSCSVPTSEASISLEKSTEGNAPALESKGTEQPSSKSADASKPGSNFQAKFVEYSKRQPADGVQSADVEAKNSDTAKEKQGVTNSEPTNDAALTHLPPAAPAVVHQEVIQPAAQEPSRETSGESPKPQISMPMQVDGCVDFSSGDEIDDVDRNEILFFSTHVPALYGIENCFACDIEVNREEPELVHMWEALQPFAQVDGAVDDEEENNTDKSTELHQGTEETPPGPSVPTAEATNTDNDNSEPLKSMEEVDKDPSGLPDPDATSSVVDTTSSVVVPDLENVECQPSSHPESEIEQNSTVETSQSSTAAASPEINRSCDQLTLLPLAAEPEAVADNLSVALTDAASSVPEGSEVQPDEPNSSELMQSDAGNEEQSVSDTGSAPFSETVVKVTVSNQVSQALPVTSHAADPSVQDSSLPQENKVSHIQHQLMPDMMPGAGMIRTLSPQHLAASVSDHHTRGLVPPQPQHPFQNDMLQRRQYLYHQPLAQSQPLPQSQPGHPYPLHLDQTSRGLMSMQRFPGPPAGPPPPYPSQPIQINTMHMQRIRQQQQEYQRQMSPRFGVGYVPFPGHEQGYVGTYVAAGQMSCQGQPRVPHPAQPPHNLQSPVGLGIGGHQEVSPTEAPHSGTGMHQGMSPRAAQSPVAWPGSVSGQSPLGGGSGGSGGGGGNLMQQPLASPRTIVASPHLSSPHQRSRSATPQLMSPSNLHQLPSSASKPGTPQAHLANNLQQSMSSGNNSAPGTPSSNIGHTPPTLSAVMPSAGPQLSGPEEGLVMQDHSTVELASTLVLQADAQPVTAPNNSTLGAAITHTQPSSDGGASQATTFVGSVVASTQKVQLPPAVTSVSLSSEVANLTSQLPLSNSVAYIPRIGPFVPRDTLPGLAQNLPFHRPLSQPGYSPGMKIMQHMMQPNMGQVPIGSVSRPDAITSTSHSAISALLNQQRPIGQAFGPNMGFVQHGSRHGPYGARLLNDPRYQPMLVPAGSVQRQMLHPAIAQVPPGQSTYQPHVMSSMPLLSPGSRAGIPNQAVLLHSSQPSNAVQSSQPDMMVSPRGMAFVPNQFPAGPRNLSIMGQHQAVPGLSMMDLQQSTVMGLPGISQQGPSSRPKRLDEQPLLLEDLLEQEKLEQQRQAEQQQQSQQSQSLQDPPNPPSSCIATSLSATASPAAAVVSNASSSAPDSSAILTDADLDKLVMPVDVMLEDFHPSLNMVDAFPGHHPQPILQHQQIEQTLQQTASDHGWVGLTDPSGHLFSPRSVAPQLGPRMQPFMGQLPQPGLNPGMCGPTMIGPAITYPVMPISLQPAPPRPPDPPSECQTEEDQQMKLKYEEWLVQFDQWIATQIHNLEAQIGKYRKTKKALNAKLRVAKKNSSNLSELDQQMLQTTTHEQSSLQKQLDQMRKQLRTHKNLISEYRAKQPEPLAGPWAPVPGLLDVGMQFVGQPVMPSRQSPSSSTLPVAVGTAPRPVPRMPGATPAARLPPEVRQEYEAYVQNRIRMRQVHPPRAVIVRGDENNPFSESYQQREHLEKLRQQQEQMQVVEQQQQQCRPLQSEDQSCFEATAGRAYGEQGQVMLQRPFLRFPQDGPSRMPGPPRFPNDQTATRFGPPLHGNFPVDLPVRMFSPPSGSESSLPAIPSEHSSPGLSSSAPSHIGLSQGSFSPQVKAEHPLRKASASVALQQMQQGLPSSSHVGGIGLYSGPNSESLLSSTACSHTSPTSVVSSAAPSQLQQQQQLKVPPHLHPFSQSSTDHGYSPQSHTPVSASLLSPVHPLASPVIQSPIAYSGQPLSSLDVSIPNSLMSLASEPLDGIQQAPFDPALVGKPKKKRQRRKKVEAAALEDVDLGCGGSDLDLNPHVLMAAPLPTEFALGSPSGNGSVGIPRYGFRPDCHPRFVIASSDLTSGKMPPHMMDLYQQHRLQMVSQAGQMMGQKLKMAPGSSGTIGGMSDLQTLVYRMQSQPHRGTAPEHVGHESGHAVSLMPTVSSHMTEKYGIQMSLPYSSSVDVSQAKNVSSLSTSLTDPVMAEAQLSQPTLRRNDLKADVSENDESEGKVSSQNVLIKKLLKPSIPAVPTSGTNQLSEDEESIHLTPEQQLQLELIERMPYTIKKSDDVDSNSAEEKELKKREFEIRLKMAEQQPKATKPRPRPKVTKPDGTEGERVTKKRRKSTFSGTVDPVMGMIHQQPQQQQLLQQQQQQQQQEKQQQQQLLQQPFSGKGVDKVDYGAISEQLMQLLHQLPPIALQEPEVKINYAVWPMLGTSLFCDGGSSTTELQGSYGSAYIDAFMDYYNIPPFLCKSSATPVTNRGLKLGGSVTRESQSPRAATEYVPESHQSLGFDGLGPFNKGSTMLDVESRLQARQSSDDAAVMAIGSGSSSGMSLVSSILSEQQARPYVAERLKFPSPPLIEPHFDALSRKSDQSPLTIISSSSPELNPDENSSSIGNRFLKLICTEKRSENCASPDIPIACPLPLKVITRSDTKHSYSEKINENNKDRVSISRDLDSRSFKELKACLPSKRSQEQNQVSVKLTLSPNAAENISGVIAAIADLLRIAVPPSYEISRSPSPTSDMFRSGFMSRAKLKEEAVNIQSLMLSKQKVCLGCQSVILGTGIRKKKTELSSCINDHQNDFGELDEAVFCDANCLNQFETQCKKSATSEFKVGSKSRLQSEPSSMTTKVDEASAGGNAEVKIKAEYDTKLQDFNSDAATKFAVQTPSSKAMTKLAETGNALQGPPVQVPSETSNRLLELEDKRKRKIDDSADDNSRIMSKKPKITSFKRWAKSVIGQEISPPTEAELNEIMEKKSTTIRPRARLEDTRKCTLCHEFGDGSSNGPGRLLIMDADKWVHLNCALWSYEVYETMNGALVYVDQAYKRGLTLECVVCHKNGATLSCFRQRCTNIYHVHCAQIDGAMFFQDKTIMCSLHAPKFDPGNVMSSITVLRRVYVNRDENKQIARVIHLEDKKSVLRIGGLIIHNLGQLLPHQIHSGLFNTAESIYPVGFKSTRYYWSYRQINKRCRYVCKIEDQNGRPQFVVTVLEKGMDQVILKNSSCKEVWEQALMPLEEMRRENDLVKIFPAYMTGEDLFGLTEPAVLKIIESLPGIEMLSGYNFRYGKSAIYKLPLAVNPSGSARTEPKLRTHFKKPHTLHGSSNSRSLPSTVTVMPGDVNSPYLKQFVHSKSQQYRRLKTEWRNNVYLRRSNIQGLGLFAARELEKHTMVIEYIGQLIRSEVAEKREKLYEKTNHGVYMFRIDDNCVVDATMSGGPARYVNHSCNPNCVAEVVPFEKDSKIIIITKRKISQGEELCYDYKFDFEDDQHKIPCLCGAANCRKWMN